MNLVLILIGVGAFVAVGWAMWKWLNPSSGTLYTEVEEDSFFAPSVYTNSMGLGAAVGAATVATMVSEPEVPVYNQASSAALAVVAGAVIAESLMDQPPVTDNGEFAGQETGTVTEQVLSQPYPFIPVPGEVPVVEAPGEPAYVPVPAPVETTPYVAPYVPPEPAPYVAPAYVAPEPAPYVAPVVDTPRYDPPAPSYDPPSSSYDNSSSFTPSSTD